MSIVNLNLRTVLKSVSLSALTLLLSVTVLYAASTIGAAISTTSTLDVTGLSTLTGGILVNNATSTINNLDMVTATTTTLYTTTASSTGLVKVDSLKFPRAADSTLSGMAFGYCTAPSVTGITASTTGMLSCSGATGVLSGDRVFVQATSSLPANFTVQTASTTAAGVIQINVFNSGWNTAVGGASVVGSTASGVNSFNFWAVR